MASIPSNGYAEVMAGSNNYSGSNSYDGSCPQTAIPPVVNNDLCNKLYVDTAGAGGIINLLTEKGSLIAGDGTAAAIFAQNPYETPLSTTTVYDWNSLAVAQSRSFTTTVPTSLINGTSIKITYNGTDEITGTITSIVGTTVTITITALASAVYVAVPQITTTIPVTISGSITNGDWIQFFPATTTPSTGITPANTIITNGICYIYDALPPSPTFALYLTGTGNIQRAVSNLQPPPAYPGSPTPSSVTWSGTNGGCFVRDSQALNVILVTTPPGRVNFGFPFGAPLTPAYFAGVIEGYQVPYSTGVISIVGNVCLLADPVAPQGLKWGVVAGGGGGGAVNSVSGGVNITISGALATPTVNLSSPLTAELNCGTQSLRDRASSVGTSGQVLTAGTGGQVLWGANGVSSVTAGTNIGITGTSTAPIVGLLSPLTAELNCGTQSLRDSASSVGTSGQVLTAGTGGQVLWGANGVSSITAGNNIGITGTSTAPIVGLLTPLTATLALGTQNITGSTSNITLSSGTNQANMNGNLGFTSVVQATPTTKANLFNTSISIETSVNKVAITPTSILKSAGSATLTVGSAIAPLSLIGSGGTADGIQIQQSVNSGTTLSTNLSNVRFYPDYYLSNNNANSVGVPAPQVDYQRLTLNNLGLTNTNTWSDYGNNVYSGYSAFTIDGTGNYWYAEQGSGNIQVIDSVGVVVATLQLQFSGNPGTINCFYQQGGFMWIGGLFSSVQDAGGINATPQFSITRINTGTYLCDPTYDGFATIYGAFPGTEVYCITDVNGEIVYGGNFDKFSNATPCNYVAKIGAPYVVGGSQIYTEFANGVNAKVYAIHHEPFLNYTFLGGDFTSVDVNGVPQGFQYCSYYDNGTTTWFNVALNNFNAGVKVIKSTGYGYLFVAGNFGQIAGTGQDYNTYIDPATPANWSDTTLFTTNPIDYKQAHYSGEIGVYNAGAGAFYKSASYQVWTSLSSPGGSGTLTGVNNNAGWKVIYDSYGYVRQHAVLPHSCEFQGTFIYDGTNYTKYTITTRNVSQQFIGDIDNSYWSIIGQGVGTFS